MKLNLPDPPYILHRLLTWLHPDDTLEEVEGDLGELYEQWHAESGRVIANLKYLVNVISVLPPFVRRRKKKEEFETFPKHSVQLTMISNYFKIALRTLSRNKLYTTLNVAGLTFGLTCFLLIGLYLFDELTFDQQHANANRIYRVIENKSVKGEETASCCCQLQVSRRVEKSNWCS